MSEKTPEELEAEVVLTPEEEAVQVDDSDEKPAPSFGEIKDEAKEEVGQVAERLKTAGLSPFRRAVDDVVDRGIDLLDTLADVWAGKKKKDG